MSRKLPLYAVDKVQLTVRVPVETKVRLDRAAADAGLPPAALAAAAVTEAVKDAPFGPAELLRVREIIEANILRRDRRKLEKGAF